jgi:hypothetical protein
LKVQASCGQRDPRKLDRKAAVIMAQLRCKSFDKISKGGCGVKDQVRQAVPISNLYLHFNPEFRHRLSTTLKLPFQEARKIKKKGKEK